MIRIGQIKVPIEKIKDHTDKAGQLPAIRAALAKKLRIPEEEIGEIQIVKRSLDARKKEAIHYSYTVKTILKKENRSLKHKDVTIVSKKEPSPNRQPDRILKKPPVIAGMGPAGLFCALQLAKAGFCPIVLERGACVEDRVKAVEAFWLTNQLDTETNVQFGEGGAGTFSDGKLNTMVKDPVGRHKEVLELFVRYGAPEEIVYINKPHIGTDRLRRIVKEMREEIIRCGGTVQFHSKVTDVLTEPAEGGGRRVSGVVVNGTRVIPCQTLVLAIGHSARDTFSMLWEKGVSMEQKAFAVGLRIEHLQEEISRCQFGEQYKRLPAADYKLTARTAGGRSVYSFCMCPGGFVVNASSEEGRIAINGMSNYDRDEKNANSALVVSVTPEDYKSYIPEGEKEDNPLAGMYFQRRLEELAYKTGKGLVPVQQYGDFKENRASVSLGRIKPNIKGGFQMANLRECLPDIVSLSLLEAMGDFERRLKGFACPDAVLSGVETRTSSPVRILRGEKLTSNIGGIYPCGEGAGYAGGITSAAMDGLKVYEAIAFQKDRV